MLDHNQTRILGLGSAALIRHQKLAKSSPEFVSEMGVCVGYECGRAQEAPYLKNYVPSGCPVTDPPLTATQAINRGDQQWCLPQQTRQASLLLASLAAYVRWTVQNHTVPSIDTSRRSARGEVLRTNA